MQKRTGSITLLTLVILTFNLILIGFVNQYYAQRITTCQNEIFYYQQANKKLALELENREIDLLTKNNQD